MRGRGLAVVLVWLLGLVTGAAASAAIVPAAGAVDPRVRELVYEPDQVVRLTGYVGYHIDLQLENGERFVALGAGDSAALDVASEGAHVLLKPKAASVATNLTLVSSRRVYHFEGATGYRNLSAKIAVFNGGGASIVRYSK